MKTKKKLLTLTVSALMCTHTHANPLTVCDFEDYPLGTEWTMWNTISSTAKVEADPLNANNKVLHVVLKDWGCHPEFTLSTELTGKALTDRYPTLRYQLYRSPSETDDYKQFAVFLGSEELYRDEGYPHQGDMGVWQTKAYTLKSASADNTSLVLRLGIHHNNSDFYIDNIQLVGEYDDYVEAEDGQVFDYCVNNTSSSYKTINTPLYIPAGVTANVRTSRYSEWISPVAGKGTLNIYAGGERSYIGSQSNKGATYPDWTKMTGDVHVYPYKDVIGSCGFYGLMLQSGTFSPDNYNTTHPNTLFTNSRLTIHSGAAIAAESGTRGFRIGELNLEEGAEIRGYYKNSTANSYYIIGGLNTDNMLAGKISPSNSGNKIGLIKEGKGACIITGNDNNINSGVMVNAGALLVCNDAAAAANGKKSGATGTAGTVMVAEGARLGGNGSIAATTDCYGVIEPGTTDYDTLTFADYATSKDVKLTLHPKSYIKINARSASEYSTVNVKGSVVFSNTTQDFLTSDAAPRLKLLLADDASFSINDEITLLTCSTMPEGGMAFDMRYPQRYTFTTEQRELADGSFLRQIKKVLVDDLGKIRVALKEADAVLLGVKVLVKDHKALAAAVDLVLGNADVDGKRLKSSGLKLGEGCVVVRKLVQAAEGSGKRLLAALFLGLQKLKGGGACLHADILAGQIRKALDPGILSDDDHLIPDPNFTPLRALLYPRHLIDVDRNLLPGFCIREHPEFHDLTFLPRRLVEQYFTPPPAEMSRGKVKF